MIKVKKVLSLSAVVMLLPIAYGIYYYGELPKKMAIHWGFNNVADGFAAKPLVVFGLPFLLIAFQAIIVFSLVKKLRDESNAQVKKIGRLNLVTLWIMPVMTLVLYPVTIQVNLGTAIDIRRVVVLLVGAMFIALGNYMPKAPGSMIHLGSRVIGESNGARQGIRALSYTMVLSGILFVLSLFFATWVSVFVLFLAIGGTLGVSLWAWQRR